MKKFILFVVCCLIGCLQVSAAENDSNVIYEYIDNIYSNRQIGEEFYTGEQGIVYVNGRLTYCLDATLTLKESIYSSSTDFSIRGIDENALNYLEMVSYFGYGYNGRNDKHYYLATQEIIWEYLSGGNIYWTDGKGGEVIDISYYKSEILTSVNEYSLLTPNIPLYIETYQNEDIVLEDNNNVLKYYEPDSWVATISENKLTLNTEFKGTTKVNFVKQRLSYMTSYIYYCNGSQTLASFGYSREEADSIEITYKVKNQSKISVVIQDSWNQKIIKNKEIKIRIYDVTRNEYIIENDSDIFTIGNSGILELDRLFEEGVYQIEEIEPPLGYQRANSHHTFYIHEYDSAIKTIIFYKQPIHYDININTKQEIFIGVDDTIDGIIGDYVLENANEIVYGLYADENIYEVSGSGDILYEKDSLIVELKIENGKAQYIGIPYGNYYLKELSCNEKYELDTNITRISFKDENNVLYLNLIKYLKKGNLTITKVSNDITLAGAEFKLYGEQYLSDKKLISNALGLIRIKDIPYDTYYLSETKAPEGYILDSDEKMIVLNSPEYTYKFQNEKETIIEPPVDTESTKEPEKVDKPQDSEPSDKSEELIIPEEPEIPNEQEEHITPQEPEVPKGENKLPEYEIKDNQSSDKVENDEYEDNEYDYIIENPNTSVSSPDGFIIYIIVYIYLILWSKRVNNNY